MADNETVGQRFTQLISHLGISKNAFAASLDKTATVIQHLVDERNKPGFDLLCKVFEVYPNVSKDWLMQGTGPMLTAAEAASSAKQPEAAALGITEEIPTASQNPSGTLAAEAVATPTAAATATTTPAGPSAPVAAPVGAPAAPPASAPAVADASWQTALYTQQMAHQLAMAELRNQHLQEQQRLMQQMLDLMQRKM
jgi:hypothetical protein